ncbi:hypothetical protein SAMN04490186_4400 [Pseudomonas grimontii]|uniref:Uncharacterized protein n=1 Tax=Pseudomonas grimontii TaxID=129847 RepID=A0A1H1HIA0_9PSED|nr:hypothetical protein [Pseudomonas grimontii]TWR64063.1 hypothetical protein FIV39_20675 [Pseudomonas grimontii]SDR25131.1 hypothetical protein SAMN04490186_4400 [Pseudomonas grimontii]
MNTDYLLNLPLKFWFSAGIMFVVLVIDVVGIFLMYRRLDEMEERLNKCKLVTFSKGFWGNSIRGRMVRLCVVMSTVAMPWWNIKRGIVDRQQVQDFPRGLKRVLQGMTIGGIIFISVAIADTLYKWLSA